MTGIENLLLIIALAVMIIWLLRKQKGSTEKTGRHASKSLQAAGRGAPAEKLKKLRQSGKFRGVEIKNGNCPAALRLAGKHFPIGNVPQLPLEGCSSSHCTCTYAGQSEHRNLERRLADERRDEIRFDVEHPDRRSHKDRRHDVSAWKDRG